MAVGLLNTLLDAAELGTLVTRLLDGLLVCEAADGAWSWRFPTPAEIQGDEAWATLKAFRGEDAPA